MLFDPHSQIQEEPVVRLSHNSLNSHYFISNSNPLLHHIPQSYRSDELYRNSPNHTNNTSNESPNSSNMCSYDIYGNELSLEDEQLANMMEPREMELECIQEEEVMSPDGVTVNQENNDPVLQMITPLKKRARFGVAERRRSFAVNRSPLIDITPVSRRRKCSHHLETRIEGSLLYNTTPRDDQKKTEGEVIPIGKLR